MKSTCSFRLASLSLILGAACLAADAARATEIYSETFTATSTQSQKLETFGGGWAGYVGATAKDVTAGSANADVISIGYFPGPPDTSWLLMNNGATPDQAFAVVATFSALTVPFGSSITWNMGNANPSITVRFLVQVEGNWYASDSTFTTTTPVTAGAHFAKELEEGSAALLSINFNKTGSNWRSFILTPGSRMELGEKLGKNLTSNAVTGFGFYVISATAVEQATRIKNLTVTSP